MSLPLKPTSYQPQSFDPGFKYPAPDFGTLQAFGDSAADTFQNSTLGGSLMQAGQYKLADVLSKQAGIAPITEQEFKTKFAAGGRIKWEKDMSPARAELMFEHKGDEVSNQNRAMGGEHAVAGLVGGLVGSLHPVDMLFGSAINKATVFAGASAKTASASELLAKQLSIPDAALGSIKHALVENALQEGAVASTAGYRQNDYNLQDFVIGVGAGTLFSGTLGTVRAISANVSPGVARAMAAASVDAFMRGEKPGAAAQAASLDPRVHRAAQTDARAAELHSQGAPVTDADLDDLISRMSGGGDDARLTAAEAYQVQLDARLEAINRVKEMEDRRSAVSQARVEASDALGNVQEGFVQRAPMEPVAPPAPAKAPPPYKPSRVQKLTIKTAMARSRAAKSAGSEAVISEAFKRVFGVDVRFYEGGDRNFFGGYGATSAHSPNTLFVEAGGMSKMLYVAGHEFAHSVRYRDPEAWKAMVKAIANSGDGSLRKAYRDAVSVQGESKAWKLMGAEKRFDESMANVFGRAMQSEAFWAALRTDRTAFEKLVSFVRHAVEKLGTYLKGKSSPETQAMYAELVGILAKVDPENKVSDAVWLNKKTSTEQLRGIYSPYASRFQSMLREEAVVTRDHAHQVDQLQDVLNEFAPEHGTLDDKSIRLVKIERNQVLRTLDPQSFVVGVLFKKYYPKLWEKFQEARKAGPEEAKKMRRELLASGPPFSYKLNDDGSYDFFIHRNDDFVKWRENRDPLVDDTLEAVVAKQYADDGISPGDEVSGANVFKALTQLYNQFAYGDSEIGLQIKHQIELGNIKDGYVNIAGEKHPNFIYVGHLRDYMSEGISGNQTRLAGGQLKDFASEFGSDISARRTVSHSRLLGEYEDFLAGYLDFLEAAKNKYLLESDTANYANIQDRIKDITRFLGQGNKQSQATGAIDSDAFGADLKKKGKEAFDAFRKELKLSNDRLSQKDMGLTEFKLGDAVVLGTPEAVARLRLEIRKEVKHELDFNKMVFTSTGVFTANTDAHLTAWIDANLEKLTDERMRGIITNYDQIPLNERAANDVLNSPLSIQELANAGKDIASSLEGNRLLSAAESDSASVEQMFDNMAVNPKGDFPAHVEQVTKYNREEQRRRVMTEWQAAHQAESAVEAELNNTKAWREGHSQTLLNELEAKYHTMGLSKALDAAYKLEDAYAAGMTKDEIAALDHAYQSERRLLAPPEEEVLGRVMTGRKRMNIRVQALESLFNEGNFSHLTDKGVKGLSNAELAEIQALLEYHQRNTPSLPEALIASRADIVLDANIQIFHHLRTREKTDLWNGLADQGVKWVFSKLDGLSRKGVRGAGASVSAEKHVQISRDTAALLNVIERDGNGKRWQSNELTRAVILEIQGHKSGDAGIENIAKILRSTSSSQMGRLNSRGARIRFLDDYVFSAVHDSHRITKAGFDTWAAAINDMIDWDKTRKAIGDVDAQGYLREVYDDIATGRLREFEGTNPDMVGGNIANQMGRRRNINFKPGMAFDYDMKFGSGDTASLIVSQIIRRSEQSVLMDNFGPNVKQTWANVMQKNFSKERSALGSIEIRSMDATFHLMAGDTDHPVNTKLALWGQSIRAYVNVVAAWGSTISSVTDLAGATSMMRFMGMSGAEVEKTLLSALKDAHNRGGDQQAWLRGQGAGLQSLLGAFTRASSAEVTLPSHIRKMNDLVFKYNGMNWWSRIVQEASVDVFTQHLGKVATAGEIPAEFKTWLNHYGITEDEFRSMSRHAKEVEGIGGVRLSPDMIRDPALSKKLAIALDDAMRYALLEPSTSDNAILRFGTRAGTVEGEAIRTIMQYKSFPLALLRKVNSRFMHAYGEENLLLKGSPNRAMKEKMAMFASMLFLGWIALSIKDVLRGREPMHFLSGDQWNTENLTRLMAQAGTLGLFEDIFHTNENRQISALLGPAGGMAYNMGRSALSENTSGKASRVVNSAFSSLPFASVPFTTEARKAILGSVFSDTLGVWDQASRKRRRTITGQGDILLDSSVQTK